MTKDNLLRELEKISDALGAARKHFVAESEMNAALHMSPTVRPAPLATAVVTADENLATLIESVRSEGVDP